MRNSFITFVVRYYLNTLGLLLLTTANNLTVYLRSRTLLYFYIPRITHFLPFRKTSFTFLQSYLVTALLGEACLKTALAIATLFTLR